MPAKDYEEKILTSMLSVLYPFGYSKQRALFVKQLSDDVVQMIQLQKSQASTKEHLRVTVNVGVLSLPLAKRLGYHEQKPQIPLCHWRVRLGHLMPMKQDRWWEVKESSDAEEVGREIADLLTNYAIPSVEEVNTTEKLRSLWESDRCPGLTDFQRIEYLTLLQNNIQGK